MIVGASESVVENCGPEVELAGDRAAPRGGGAGRQGEPRATASRAFCLMCGVKVMGLPGRVPGCGSGSSGKASTMAWAARGSKAAAAWRIAAASLLKSKRSSIRARAFSATGAKIVAAASRS